MYRIFCESYYNFINTFNDKNSRLKLAEILRLIVDLKKYKEEKEMESDLYKKISDLIFYLNQNIYRFPRMKAFLWTLSSRGIEPKKYGIAKENELEEQAKIVNSFLKLAYWY